MTSQTTSGVHPTPSGSLPRTALVFSGGGLKGAAFVGALVALERAGCAFDLVGGTSAGAVIASFMGAGMRAAVLACLFVVVASLPSRRLRDVNIRGFLALLLGRLDRLTGVVKGDRLEAELRRRFAALGVTTFADLSRPTFVVAVNALTGEEIVCTNMPQCALEPTCYAPEIHVADAVRASISIPGLFVPKVLRGAPCVDGGVRNYLPLVVAHALGARDILGLTFEQGEETHAQVFGHGVASILGRTIDLSIADQVADGIALLQAQDAAPAIVRIPVGTPQLFDLAEIPRIIAAGESAMHTALTANPALIAPFKT